MSKLTILIMGRTGSGKDYLANLLAREGMVQVISYTTRPKRSQDENTHIFISEREAEMIPNEEKAARTMINGYEYFATRRQIEASDIYIVDPAGFYELIQKMPKQRFLLIYLNAKKSRAKAHAVRRAEDEEAEAQIFEARYASEDQEFFDFEDALFDASFESVKGLDFNGNTIPTLITTIKGIPFIRYIQDYDPDSAKEFVEEIQKEMVQANRYYDEQARLHFGRALAEIEPTEWTGYIGQMLDELNFPAEATGCLTWLEKIYDIAARYVNEGDIRWENAR